MKHDAFTITPKAGLFYAYTSSDSYTETGAGGMNLVVNPDDTSMLEGSIGVNVAYDHKVSGGMLRPEVRAAVLYEFLDDNASATSRFTGAGATFNTEGLDTAQLGGTLGFGVGYTTADGMWEIRGDYDAELRQDFVGHSGMLTGRVNF
jgi:outer membrane autotransporter protein